MRSYVFPARLLPGPRSACCSLPLCASHSRRLLLLLPDGQTQINTTATDPSEAEPQLSADGLASLVAPIALYPDALLIQVLAASTYPLEVVQLKQWLDENKKLNGNALAEAVAQQNWDPSVQALAAFPAVVEKLANNIQWTTDLGNAFLAQESDLMDAVQGSGQRHRRTAHSSLTTNRPLLPKRLRTAARPITIEPAQREVVYVPTYNTTGCLPRLEFFGLFRLFWRIQGRLGYSGYPAHQATPMMVTAMLWSPRPTVSYGLLQLARPVTPMSTTTTTTTVATIELEQ